MGASEGLERAASLCCSLEDGLDRRASPKNAAWRRRGRCGSSMYDAGPMWPRPEISSLQSVTTAQSHHDWRPHRLTGTGLGNVIAAIATATGFGLIVLSGVAGAYPSIAVRTKSSRPGRRWPSFHPAPTATNGARPIERVWYRLLVPASVSWCLPHRQVREIGLGCGTSSYGSDGTRTRDLRRDRPAL